MIKNDEKLSLLLQFFLAFLIGFLQFAKHRRFLCTQREIRSSLVNFSFLDSALKSRSFHIIIQTLVSLRRTIYTLLYTIIHYYTLLYTIIHYYTLLYTIIHYYTLLYTIIHYYTLFDRHYTLFDRQRKMIHYV